MTIEASSPISPAAEIATGVFTRAAMDSALATSSPAAATSSVTPAVNPAAIEAARQQIQQHLAGLISPPQFHVDYLSGIDVMTVRAAGTGELLFQLPGTAAVQLAQLIKEGAPVDSFGLLDKTA